MKRLVYATTNPGKFQEVRKFLASHNLRLHAPSEYQVELDVEESGNTLEENATLKAKAFLNLLPNDSIVIGDDTGVEISALNGEPGIKVRRWKGEHMTDQEIIDYCIARMKDVKDGSRQAQFRTVLAVTARNHDTKLFDGILPGHIVQDPTLLKIKGFPFESLLYVDEYKMMLGEIHQLTAKEKAEKTILTHRERALNSSLSYLRQLLAEA